MKSGIEQIADERTRQIEVEGWTAKHDDQHERGELTYAAAAYLIFRSESQNDHMKGQPMLPNETILNQVFPQTWSKKWFKPTKRSWLY